MDKDKREDKKRDAPNVAETKKKDQFKSLFAQLRALLQTHGYPVKGDREKKLQSTSALSQKKEDQVNPETSKEISNWIPSFHSYEDFNRRTLQSLGGFIIILSTDGVIISVAENISSLLGYLPDEIVGKKLLSLLPDQEKREVFQKICLKFPVSNSEKHMEFCCHLKRGNLQSGGNLTYEYAKFILTIKDISDEPVVLLSRFFPSPNYIESSTTQLPLEDRFYIVGTVCILRAQTLRELLTVQETSEDIEIIELSDKDNSSILINVQDQRTSSGMEPLPAESAVVALKKLAWRPEELEQNE
ncbi:circadian clock protein PASD1 [Molossus molossus]|uniref:circadian clock protein PASD1 n=1 Tax=Molossus molossus TaxID=27622 RepID=UPI001746DB2F|nr:circadian clock protein PASD1 [Molossus molossus]